MENKKNITHHAHGKNNQNVTAQISKPEPSKPDPVIIGKEAFLILNPNVKTKATVFGVRYSKNKIHYDLNVFTDAGIIPFYNIDSAVVKFEI